MKSTGSSRTQKFLKILKYGFPVCFGLLMVMLVFLFSIIYFPLLSFCRNAQKVYGGDCVEAIIEYIESDRHPYKEKNHAIWAIGQLGDPRAVPVLEKLQTG